MAEQAYAYVTLIPVAKGFQGAIAKELGGVGGIGAKAGDEAGKGFGGGFGKALGGIATVVGGALAAAGVGSFFKESITAASDLNESLNAVSVSYGAATQGIVSLGETAANRLGLSQNQFNAIATQFSGFATNIAGAGGDVVGFIDELTTRGADFASVFNLDVDEALRLFQSGLAGETEPLRKYGLDLSAATVESYAYANGIAAAGEPLTEAQKQQARYGALLEQTAKVQGDFTNTSDSLANAQRILGANFENVQATVGGPLLNAFANLTTALIPVVNELGPVLVQTVEQLAPTITNLAGTIPGLLTQLFPLIPVIGELVGLFLELVQAALPFIVEAFMAMLPIIQQLIPIVVDFMDAALEPIMGIFYALLEAIGPLVEALLPIFAELLLALLPVVMELFYAFEPLIMALLPLFIDFLEFLTPILTTVAEIIGVVLVAAIQFFVNAIDFVTDAVGKFSQFFKDTFNGIKSFFTGIINGMLAGFEGFANGIIKGINFVIRALNKIQVKAPQWVTDLTGITSWGINISELALITLPRVALAKGGLVTGPTNALVGEAGPELVIPLDRFESMVKSANGGPSVNYYAAPNKSLDAEQELLMAMRRVRLFA